MEVINEQEAKDEGLEHEDLQTECPKCGHRGPQADFRFEFDPSAYLCPECELCFDKYEPREGVPGLHYPHCEVDADGFGCRCGDEHYHEMQERFTREQQERADGGDAMRKPTREDLEFGGEA